MGVKKSTGRKNRNNVARRRWLIGGLAVFVLFDVGLVAFALTATKPAAGAGTVAEPSVVEPSAVDPVESTPAAAEPVETKPGEAASTVTPTRIMAALNTSTAWRASTGACPATKAAPELTTDSGATWDSFDASAATDASSILAINVADKNETSLVTLDVADCAPQLVSTFVAGDAWKAYPDRVAATWFVDPAMTAVVHSPAGDQPAPCTAVAALAATDDTSAAVLCTDGSLITTGDSGATWSAPAAVVGAANLTATSLGYDVAVVNPSGCAGVSVVKLSTVGTLDATPRACLPATVNPGETAISASADGTLWLWAGDAFGQSTDGGASWR
ncbi:hypothetical protein RCH16_003640 [Cryobacterium sp. MP_M5]|uniref:hypothetical protein n=1 Tax=unclassified Cryobacterium TaxID=2649013 RepID=UPI0018CA9A6C|nr:MULTISPECIES: hypothetical protein [unclassified Cryobacterium]MBG6060165.1 hypothetical protein [Cryobacterium sp. MP_M3]MEC5178601.1 hypothetical protein [Cryobacterium sp. MP_M5]